jgi:hypothetical protein
MKSPLEYEYVVRAFYRLRKRDWGDLGRSLNDPIHRKLIYGMARAIQGMSEATRKRYPANTPINRRAVATPAHITLDRKRLAAGEREDD